MRDSGVEWLGEIPAHWCVVPLSALADYVNGAVFEPADWTDEGVPIIRIQNLTGGSDTYNYFNGEKPEHYRVRNGDMLISWSASIDIFIWRGCDAWLNQHIFKVDNLSEKVSKAFFHFSIQNTIRALISQAHGSTMKHIVRGAFLRTKASLPPLAEQRAIAAYLDRETAQIDALIAKTEQLNALLGEKRGALISQAVTKGLDPAAPLKESGVEWLGEIPRHWEVVPLRWRFHIRSGEFLDNENVESFSENGYSVPVVGGNGVLGYTGIANTFEPTIVIGRVGAQCGNVHLIASNSWITDNALRLSRIKGFFPKYLAELLRALDLNRLSVSTAQPLLTGGQIKNLTVVCPPLAEQHAIAGHLDRETAKIDALIAKNVELIALLREKRTSLISAAVTGKIDLRNEA